MEWKDRKIIYKRYASLFFIACVSADDNELLTLEIIHQYVEVLDKYFGNVCELDIIFNFHKVRGRRGEGGGCNLSTRSRPPTPPPSPQAFYILDEMLLNGEMQETNKREVLRVTCAQDDLANPL